jgi:F-type H+-transporting ATPase subunit b
MENLFVPVAFAMEAEGQKELTATTEVAEKTAEHSEGLQITPSTVAFQALNFLVLLIVLKFILYKPLMQVLQEREKRIKEGVENAEKADRMLAESEATHQNILKTAKVESHGLLDSARKSAEEIRKTIIETAHNDAGKIIESGKNIVEMEKTRAAQELKNDAVRLVLLAAEKVLKEKLDPDKDRKLIEESLNSYSQ